MRRRSVNLASMAAAVLLIAGLATAAWAAPSAADIRACVERNGARYTNPGSAVDAQYSDAETACRSALEEGATAQFTPDGGGDRSTGAAAPSNSSGGGPPADDGTPGAATAPGAPASGGATAGLGRCARGQGEAPAPSAQAAAVRAVEGSAAGAGGGAGSPIPVSLTDGPPWFAALLAGAAVLILGAVGVAVRRRAN